MLCMGHEQLVFCTDNACGLRAVIAIHDTTLGPCLGGARMWKYDSEQDAVMDVLRLSRGMTFKSSLCGNDLGGGKAVIMANGNALHDRKGFFRRFGEFVDSLGGRYITAEDVGTSMQDMECISERTEHVAGLPESRGGGGDPSPVTAYGVYLGMKASAQFVFGSDNLKDKKILVQGCGHVGRNLIRLLAKEGAILCISDIREENIRAVQEESAAEYVAPENVYAADVDIYAPCALGAVLNDDSIPQLKCSIVTGAANNQLKDEVRNGKQLMERGITYAPDFLVNAGGVINCFIELQGYARKKAMERTEIIYHRTLEILGMSRDAQITPQEAAIRLAQKRIEDTRAIKEKV